MSHAKEISKDNAGALHHIMVRGIERRDVFGCETDREHFVERLGEVVQEFKTLYYALALVQNHFHLLLRT